MLNNIFKGAHGTLWPVMGLIQLEWSCYLIDGEKKFSVGIFAKLFLAFLREILSTISLGASFCSGFHSFSLVWNMKKLTYWRQLDNTKYHK